MNPLLHKAGAHTMRALQGVADGQLSERRQYDMMRALEYQRDAVANLPTGAYDDRNLEAAINALMTATHAIERLYSGGQ